MFKNFFQRFVRWCNRFATTPPARSPVSVNALPIPEKPVLNLEQSLGLSVVDITHIVQLVRVWGDYHIAYKRTLDKGSPTTLPSTMQLGQECRTAARQFNQYLDGVTPTLSMVHKTAIRGLAGAWVSRRTVGSPAVINAAEHDLLCYLQNLRITPK